MKGYKSENIRNVALVGHGGSGKTTFLEAALLATGVISRLGKVEDGNTVSDYDKMEIEKGYSISTSVVPSIITLRLILSIRRDSLTLSVK